jgi:hypothetical protein
VKAQSEKAHVAAGRATEGREGTNK